MLETTSYDPLSPRSSSDEPRSGEEDLEIDWVLAYNFDDIGTEPKDLEGAEAAEEFRKLIHQLDGRGLQTQVRHGYGQSLLVLIRCPRNLLGNEVYRSRVKDWLHGIIHAKPVGDSKTVVKADTPAEALRSAYHLITWTHEQGGAGITAGHGNWHRVTESFPPQDALANRKLLKYLAGRTFLNDSDLDKIRALFGEKVAFYYAFIQCYSIFLIIPTICGTLTWLFSGPYSSAFAVFTCLWGIVFVEYWKRQEIDLSIRWDVRGVGGIKVNRPQYVWEREEVDSVTGELKRVFPTHKRILRQLWFLPFAALAGVVLGTVLLVTFALEALMSDVYGSVLEDRWYLQYLPTILLSVALPYISSSLTDLATKLTDFENYRTKDEYDLAQVQKSFVLNFITSFFPIVLTAYVYIPYGSRLLPLIVPSTWDAKNVVNSFDVDPGRLQEEVISLSMAAQAMNFGEEFLYPFLKRKAFEFWRQHHRQKRAATFHERNHSSPEESKLFNDSPSEARWLTRLRQESDAEEYDVHEDIMEMVVQFGYLTLFAPAWPLMPLGFLLNNWVELRGDFFKLSSESQRPPPIRADSIGDSVAALEFLTWLGTLSTAALVHIYRGPGHISTTRPSRLLLSIFVAEQVFLAVRFGAKHAFAKFGSAAVREAEAKRFMMRKTYLETFSEEKAGTSRRVRSRTYAGERRGSRAVGLTASNPGTPVGELSPVKELEKQLPSITVNDEPSANTQEFDSEYSTDAAERFWTEDLEALDTAEVGVRLIKALKAWFAKSNDSASIDDRSKAD